MTQPKKIDLLIEKAHVEILPSPGNKRTDWKGNPNLQPL